MTVRVAIKPHILKWAVARTNMSLDELSQTSDFTNIIDWIEGIKQPTIRQAELLAKRAEIPFPFLLLDDPVEDDIPLPDFRRRGDTGVVDPSLELEQVIKDCMGRLDWYLDFARVEELSPLSLLKSFKLTDDPESAAKAVSAQLGWEPGRYVAGEQAVTKLADFIEAAGILVMRSSMVKNNTKRPLNEDEFSGFTLIEGGYALIFINARDTKSAQLFSLAHELGHVILGKQGVSAEKSIAGAPRIERWCNLFAAEFLIPASYFLQVWEAQFSAQDAIIEIAHRVGASPEAVVWRGVDLGLVDRSEAGPLIRDCSYAGPRKKETGGNGLNNIRPRIGKRFLEATTSAIGSDLLSITEAMYYLGTSNRESVRALMNPKEKTA